MYPQELRGDLNSHEFRDKFAVTKSHSPVNFSLYQIPDFCSEKSERWSNGMASLKNETH